MGAYEYVLIAVDYTKCVEVAFYTKITLKYAAEFLINKIICKYGIPHKLISDWGLYIGKEVAAVVKKYKIKHHNSSLHYWETNGVVEAANTNIHKIIEKMAENYKD